ATSRRSSPSLASQTTPIAPRPNSRSNAYRPCRTRAGSLTDATLVVRLASPPAIADGVRSGSLFPAARHPLPPCHPPVAEAVPRPKVRPAGIIDDHYIALLDRVEEPLRVLRRGVDTAMADIAVPLVTDRPGRRMHELATVGDPNGPVDLRAVPLWRV